MAVTHVEIYEALKGSVGEKGARLIAEIVPPAADIARRQDVTDSGFALQRQIDGLRADTREEFAAVRGEMREGFATIRAEMQASDSRTIRWMLAFFVPMWAGTWGTLIAVLLKGA